MSTNNKSILNKESNTSNKPGKGMIFVNGKTEKAEFSVLGMSCGNCVKHVQTALSSLPGVNDVKVSLAQKTAYVEYVPAVISVEKLKKVVEDAGYELVLNNAEDEEPSEQDSNSKVDESDVKEDILTKPTDNKSVKEIFTVLGMTCASCVAHVEKALSTQTGVISASVNLATNTASVEYSPSLTSRERLKKAVDDAGYELVTEERDDADAEHQYNKEISSLKRNTIIALTLSVPLVVIAMFFHTLPHADYIMWVLATPVVFILGKSFFVNAWKQLKHCSSSMDTLVALSTSIAYLFSVFNTVYPSFWTNRGMAPHVYFEVAAVVVAFVLLGRYLEARAKGNTSEAIKQLIGMQPKAATVVKDNEFIDIAIEDIKIGDELIAKPGEKIAVDGEVVNGSSFIDESMINGEPLVVEKMKGDKVFSGTINQSGTMHYVAEKIGKDTLLSQIVKMVQDAQGSKAPIQKYVDKIASVFVPVIVIISIFTFVAWMIFGGEGILPQALMSMVTVLIIACPCALGLATPTAIMVGIGRGATNGILIKDAQALETAKSLTAIVLDKTGTITEGKPHVADMKWFVDEKDDFKDILFSIESYSEHPLGNAVIAYLKDDAKLISDIKVSVIAGQGITGRIGSDLYYAGNEKLLANNNIPVGENISNWIVDNTKNANTIALFANKNIVIAAIAIADTIKPTSNEAISKLKASGLKVYMLTGDNRQSAQMIAEQVGIDYVKSDVLPADKADFVKDLQQQQGETVAMIGDGINDSAALATSDISIAMGQGSDIAMDVAQITIISSDLNKVSQAINLSKATVRTIKQNLFWAFIYNLISVPVAAGIFYPLNGFLLNPMIAGAAMALSSVSVVTNSLLLKVRKV